MKCLIIAFFPLCLLAQQNAVKDCPDSGATILDETYPTSAIVVGEGALSEDLAFEILKSYNFSESAPEIIVSSHSSTVAQNFREAIRQRAQASGESAPASVLAKIKQAPGGTGYQWKQDFFESMINLETGRPLLRPIASRQGSSQFRSSVSGIASAANQTELGEELKTSTIGDIAEGGNIEGLPGGLCLTGNNLSKEFARQFCASDENDENNVQVDVGWLETGHVDEIFKVIPANIPDAPSQCQFSIMAASPDLAFKLLNEPANHNQEFLGSFNGRENQSDALRESFYTSRMEGVQGGAICGILRHHVLPYRPNDNDKAGSPAVEEVFIRFFDLFIGKAYGQTSWATDPSYSEEEENCSSNGSSGGWGTDPCAENSAQNEPVYRCEDGIKNVTNKEFYDGIQRNEQLVEFNAAVQESINNSKKTMKEKILKRLPDCAEHFSFLDVPNIFQGGQVVEGEDGPELVESGGTARSIFPNPTNSVLANKTVIFSDPQNNVFRNYLNTEMERKGLQSAYVDTWSAHLGGGNLHCSSHSLTYCSPNNSGQ